MSANAASPGETATVLVEGESDAVALDVIARRLGMPKPHVLAVGGSKGVRRAAAELVGRPLVGLVDAAERDDFARVLDRVFVCDPDLEGEFVRALGIDGAEAVIAEQGELASFRKLQGQPFQRGRAREEQLARFVAGRSGNKQRYARWFAEAVPLDRVPPPILELLELLERLERLAG